MKLIGKSLQKFWMKLWNYIYFPLVSTIWPLCYLRDSKHTGCLCQMTGHKCNGQSPQMLHLGKAITHHHIYKWRCANCLLLNELILLLYRMVFFGYQTWSYRMCVQCVYSYSSHWSQLFNSFHICLIPNTRDICAKVQCISAATATKNALCTCQCD